MRKAYNLILWVLRFNTFSVTARAHSISSLFVNESKGLICSAPPFWTSTIQPCPSSCTRVFIWNPIYNHQQTQGSACVCERERVTIHLYVGHLLWFSSSSSQTSLNCKLTVVCSDLRGQTAQILRSTHWFSDLWERMKVYSVKLDTKVHKKIWYKVTYETLSVENDDCLPSPVHSQQ